MCLTLFNPMDSSPPGSSVCGLFQARIVEWVVISSSRESPQPKDLTQVSYISKGNFYKFMKKYLTIQKSLYLAWYLGLFLPIQFILWVTQLLRLVSKWSPMSYIIASTPFFSLECFLLKPSTLIWASCSAIWCMYPWTLLHSFIGISVF